MKTAHQGYNCDGYELGYILGKQHIISRLNDCFGDEALHSIIRIPDHGDRLVIDIFGKLYQVEIFREGNGWVTKDLTTGAKFEVKALSKRRAYCEMIIKLIEFHMNHNKGFK